MNKSKFKSVKYLPFNLTLIPKSFLNNHFWESIGGINDASEFIRFQESTIETYPELFEVEKAEREFEDGAYYKAMFAPHSVPEIIQRFRDKFQRIGLNLFYIETDFQEIGEKIEL